MESEAKSSATTAQLTGIIIPRTVGAVSAEDHKYWSNEGITHALDDRQSVDQVERLCEMTCMLSQSYSQEHICHACLVDGEGHKQCKLH